MAIDGTMNIKCVHLAHDKTVKGANVRAFGKEQAAKSYSFHSSFPEYQETPLVELHQLAVNLGIKSIYIKDESKRFGLNAFKVLGGSYAIARDIMDRLALAEEELTYDKLTSPEVLDKLGKVTYITATDGNHGRGVAWTANRLGKDCVVYMPQGTAPERLENIRKLGADASIKECNYDGAVRMAHEQAEEHGWRVIQDTSWAGYEEIPTRIMQGYTTLGHEFVKQLAGVRPTHVFLQAGVGALAGAVTAFLADYYGKERPTIIIVEPHQADCLYRTAQRNDGRLYYAQGRLDSIMAGLCCGEPCGIAWEILRDYADYFISMPDEVAALGMRVLGNPLPGDECIVSGESGAAGFGLMAAALMDGRLSGLRHKLGLDENSVVLCISTEGDTDQDNYRRIVWQGAWNWEK